MQRPWQRELLWRGLGWRRERVRHRLRLEWVEPWLREERGELGSERFYRYAFGKPGLRWKLRIRIGRWVGRHGDVRGLERLDGKRLAEWLFGLVGAGKLRRCILRVFG